MKPNLKEKLNYNIEQFLSKGPSSLFLSLALTFIIVYVLLVALRVLLIYLFPSLSNPETLTNTYDNLWVPWLQMTDPGNMHVDTRTSGWLKITSIMAGLGGIVILSSFIAFMTTSINSVIYNIRQGKSKVLESDHTLILGWDEQVIEIIRELVIANESEKDECIVVLGDCPKEEMDNLINKRLVDKKTTRVITAPGIITNISDLKRVGVEEAKSIIVTSEYSTSASFKQKIKSDDKCIKTLLAINSCLDKDKLTSIIVEGYTDIRLGLMKEIRPNILPVNTWEIMGKILLQSTLTSGLEIVIREMLSFDGSEVYYIQSDWEGDKFYDLQFHFMDGVILGIYNSSKVLLRPPKEYRLKEGDQLIILAQDDSTIKYIDSGFKSHDNIHISLPKKKSLTRNMNTLILGWHDIARSYIKEVKDYDENAKIDIVYKNLDHLNEIKILKNNTYDFVDIIESDPMNIDALSRLKPFSYDNIIILSQNILDNNIESVDSDTVIILLLLKSIEKGLGKSDTKVITQLLNSDNQDIIAQTNVDNFVVSNKLINMLLAQLSEDTEILYFFNELFSEEGSEIYVKPSEYYFTELPVKCTFLSLMTHVNKRNEICLGIRKGNYSDSLEHNFGVILNPRKDEDLEITKHDFIVVLSEDDT